MSTKYEDASIEDMLLWIRNNLIYVEATCNCAGSSTGVHKVGEIREMINQLEWELMGNSDDEGDGDEVLPQ